MLGSSPSTTMRGGSRPRQSLNLMPVRFVRANPPRHRAGSGGPDEPAHTKIEPRPTEHAVISSRPSQQDARRSNVRPLKSSGHRGGSAMKLDMRSLLLAGG